MAVLNNIFVNREYSADVELVNVGSDLCRVRVVASGPYASEVARVQACLNAPGKVWRVSSNGNALDVLTRYPHDGRVNICGDENNPTITVSAVYFTTHSGIDILLSLRMTPNARDAWQPPASMLPISDAYPSGTSNLLARQYPTRQGVGIFAGRRGGHDVRALTGLMEFNVTQGNADFTRDYFVFCVAANSDVSNRLGMQYLYSVQQPTDVYFPFATASAVGAAAFGNGVEIGGRKNAQYYFFYAFEIPTLALKGEDVCVYLYPPGGAALPGVTEAGAYGLFVSYEPGDASEWLRRVVINMYTGDVSPWAMAQPGRAFPQIRRYASTTENVIRDTGQWGPQMSPSSMDTLNATAGRNTSGFDGALRMPTVARTEAFLFGPWLCLSRRTPDGLCAAVVERFEFDYLACEKSGTPFRMPVVYVKSGESVDVDIVTISATPLFFHDGGAALSIPRTQNYEATEATINGKAFGTQRFSEAYKSYDKATTLTNNGKETATVVVAVCSSSVIPFASPMSPLGMRMPTRDDCMFGALRFLHGDKCVDVPVYKVDEFCEFQEEAAASWAEGTENGAGLVRGWKAKSPPIAIMYADVVASAEVNSCVRLLRGRSYLATDIVVLRSLTITREADGFVVEVEIIEAEVQ